MRIIIRPALDPQREIDMTHLLVSAIAEELWRAHGGNERLNWLEAEQHLRSIVAQARAQARDTRVLVAKEAAEPIVTIAAEARALGGGPVIDAPAVPIAQRRPRVRVRGAAGGRARGPRRRASKQGRAAVAGRAR